MLSIVASLRKSVSLDGKQDFCKWISIQSRQHNLAQSLLWQNKVKVAHTKWAQSFQAASSSFYCWSIKNVETVSHKLSFKEDVVFLFKPSGISARTIQERPKVICSLNKRGSLEALLWQIMLCVLLLSLWARREGRKLYTTDHQMQLLVWQMYHNDWGGTKI